MSELTPIVLDCDPGHDDAIALLLALASPELDLLGVTTTYGNQTVDKTRETIEGLPDDASLTEVAKAVGPLLPSLQALITNVSATLTSLQEQGSELKEGFDKADSCERYR